MYPGLSGSSAVCPNAETLAPKARTPMVTNAVSGLDNLAKVIYLTAVTALYVAFTVLLQSDIVGLS